MDLFFKTVVVVVVCRNFPLNLIPKILVALSMKDSVAGMSFLMSSPQPEW